MTMKKMLLKILTVAVFTIPIVSCNDSDGSGGMTRMEIRLTDSPALYDSVNIDILSIYINATNDANSGWRQLTLLQPGIYNLLDFRNGVDTLLAGQDVPSGRINQIRLVLGPNNTVVENGISYPLEVPSAMQSGLKLNLHATLAAGITYKLWIDFDASRSIVTTGFGEYILKPVIRTYTQATGGTLEGTVLPSGANVAVWAILETDSIMAYPETNGFFRITGLQGSASWKVLYDANTPGYMDYELNDVTVTAGQVTTLDQVTLTLQQ